MSGNIATPTLVKPLEPPMYNVSLDEIQMMMYENFGEESKPVDPLYRKPYPDYF
jgi:hypothetical protein